MGQQQAMGGGIPVMLAGGIPLPLPVMPVQMLGNGVMMGGMPGMLPLGLAGRGGRGRGRGREHWMGS